MRFDSKRRLQICDQTNSFVRALSGGIFIAQLTQPFDYFRLKPVEECVDIPKEVCVRAKVNPRRIKRPIIKKWCYTPRSDENENEGLEADADNSDNADDENTTPTPTDDADQES